MSSIIEEIYSISCGSCCYCDESIYFRSGDLKQSKSFSHWHCHENSMGPSDIRLVFRVWNNVTNWIEFVFWIISCLHHLTWIVKCAQRAKYFFKPRYFTVFSVKREYLKGALKNKNFNQNPFCFFTNYLFHDLNYYIFVLE